MIISDAELSVAMQAAVDANHRRAKPARTANPATGAAGHAHLGLYRLDHLLAAAVAACLVYAAI